MDGFAVKRLWRLSMRSDGGPFLPLHSDRDPLGLAAKIDEVANVVSFPVITDSILLAHASDSWRNTRVGSAAAALDSK